MDSSTFLQSTVPRSSGYFYDLVLFSFVLFSWGLCTVCGGFSGVAFGNFFFAISDNVSSFRRVSDSTAILPFYLWAILPVASPLFVNTWAGYNGYASRLGPSISIRFVGGNLVSAIVFSFSPLVANAMWLLSFNRVSIYFVSRGPCSDVLL